MNTWNDATFDNRNEIVFEGRNKLYGAYEIRKNYNIRVTYIIACMLGFSIALMGVKTFIDNRPEGKDSAQDLSQVVVDITPPPPAEELPPPPPPPPPPPMVEMVKFTPPVIKDDAVEEEPQKLQEEVVDTNVGVKDQEGDKEIVAPPTEDKGPTEPAEQEIMMFVEEMPEPAGGLGAFNKYLSSNIVYPSMAREAQLQGTTYLKFVVEVDGSIGAVQVLKGVAGCPDCDKEAIRVLKASPKWKPGKQNGRAQRVWFNVPIKFKMQ